MSLVCKLLTVIQISVINIEINQVPNKQDQTEPPYLKLPNTYISLFTMGAKQGWVINALTNLFFIR